MELIGGFSSLLLVVASYSSNEIVVANCGAIVVSTFAMEVSPWCPFSSSTSTISGHYLTFASAFITYTAFWFS